MRCLLVIDTRPVWGRLAEMLAALGHVTIVTENTRAVGNARLASTSVPPSDASGWRAIVEDTDAIVHVGPSSQLAMLIDVLSSATERPRVLVTVDASASDASATALVTDRATPPGLRLCCARLGAWVGEDCGLIRALVPLYRCFAGLQELPDDRPISWCHTYDVARALVFAVESPEMKGPFDLVTPEPARIRGLDRAMSEALGQRPVLRISMSTASRLIGERLAHELELGSERFPVQLARLGFSFVFPDIRSAVMDVLQDKGPGLGTSG